MIGIKKEYLSREKARHVLWFGLFLIGVATYGAFFLFSQVFVDTIQTLKSRSWNTQSAFVYETKVVEQWKHGRFAVSRKIYWCSVSYLFQVRESSYIGKTRIFESKVHEKMTPANQECEKIPTNSNVQIKFDPDDPNWSCLHCTVPVTYLVLVASFIGIIGVGLFMFFAAMSVFWPEPERWI